MAVTPYQEKKYVPSDAVTQAQQALQNQQAAKPGQYQSQWQGQLNDVLGQIQNRDKFQYDINADALYQQAAQRYIQQGKQAMMDTMGQAAALTGGYGNSYAQTAGQQTYQNYLLGLTDMIPQFQQMAMQQYQMEGDDLLNRYQLLAQQEESAYGRYNDMLSRYYAELDRLQGVYDSERDYDYSRFADDRNFYYGRYMDDLNYQYQLDRDKVADDQWAQQWAYQQERDRVSDNQWKQEFAYQQSQNDRAYQQWLEEFTHQKAQDDRAYSQWQDEFNYQQSQNDRAYQQWLEEFSYQQSQADRAYDQWFQEMQYQQSRDQVADEQWRSEYEESIRQFDEKMAAEQDVYAYYEPEYNEPEYYEPVYYEDRDEAYRLYQQAVSQGYGSTAAKKALKDAGYSDEAINSAMSEYEEKVIKPLSKPVKTRHGTM